MSRLLRAVLSLLIAAAMPLAAQQQVAFLSDLAPALKMQGTYSASTSYAKNDVVVSGGVLYYGLQPSTGQTPSSGSSYWGVLTQSGGTTPVVQTTASGSLSITFPASGSIVYDVTLSADTTFAFTAPSSGGSFEQVIVLLRPAGHQATFPASSAAIVWANGSAPVPSNSNISVIRLGATGTAPIIGGL